MPNAMKLGSEDIIRIAEAVNRHPRFDRLYTGVDGLYAWLERAQQHYLTQIDRVGPTKAREQIRRIVNEVALIGGPERHPMTTIDQAAVEECIGPRRVGTRYRSHQFGDVITVLSVDRGTDPGQWPSWSVTEANEAELDRGAARTHCTPWDARDKVLSQPPAAVSQ